MHIGKTLLNVGIVGQMASFLVMPYYNYILMDEQYYVHTRLFQLVWSSFFGVITVVGAIGFGAKQIVQVMKGHKYDEEYWSLAIVMSFLGVSFPFFMTIGIIEIWDLNEVPIDLWFKYAHFSIIFVASALSLAIWYSSKLICLQLEKR